MMSFDYENETEWGAVNYEHISYNVSRPYVAGTLEKWDRTVAKGCNFGVSFGIMTDHQFADNEEWIFENIVLRNGKRLADEFDVIVYYHRTRLINENKNIERNIKFLAE